MFGFSAAEFSYTRPVPPYLVTRKSAALCRVPIPDGDGSIAILRSITRNSRRVT